MRTAFAMSLVVLAAGGCEVKHSSTSAEARQQAAAATADLVAKAVPLPAPMVLSVHGAQSYSDSVFKVTCVASESEQEQLLQVEGIARGTHVNFTIYGAREGSAPIGNYYTKRRAKTRLGNLDVTVNSNSYADGGGKATITDPYGRSGSLSASNFIKMGAKKRESHRADLSVRLRWRCDQ